MTASDRPVGSFFGDAGPDASGTQNATRPKRTRNFPCAFGARRSAHRTGDRVGCECNESCGIAKRRSYRPRGVRAPGGAVRPTRRQRASAAVARGSRCDCCTHLTTTEPTVSGSDARRGRRAPGCSPARPRSRSSSTARGPRRGAGGRAGRAPGGTARRPRPRRRPCGGARAPGWRGGPRCPDGASAGERPQVGTPPVHPRTGRTSVVQATTAGRPRDRGRPGPARRARAGT
jgi:hypothetical protein